MTAPAPLDHARRRSSSLVGPLVAFLSIAAGCGGGRDLCVCEGDGLALECGTSRCVDGVGYRCPSAGALVVDTAACQAPPADMTESADPPDLGPGCVPKSCAALGAACGTIVDNCGRSRTCPSTCGAGTLCVANQCVSHCGDHQKNGDETDVDCGGASCGKCAAGAACASTSDCQSGTCDGGICRPGSYTALMPMPTSRTDAAVAAGGGKLYVLGGVSGSALDVVEVYTPSADSWSSHPPMSTARSQFGAAFGSDGRLYAVGGRMANNWADGASRSGEAYDFGTSKWSPLATLAEQREGSRLVARASGGVAALGGVRLSKTTSGQVTSYRHGDQSSIELLASAGAWSWQPTATTMLGSRHDFGAAALSDGRILVAGGMKWRNNPAYSIGCTGLCPPAELEEAVSGVELCTIGGSCTQVTTFPATTAAAVERSVALAPVDDRTVYVFGVIEQQQSFGIGTALAWKLDLVDKTWTRVAPPPKPAGAFGQPLVNGAAVIDGKIYVVTSDALWLFTP